MPKPTNTTTPALFFADLPNADEARKAAERFAEKLAETLDPGRRETVVVTDEDGNEVCQVLVRSRN
jgi:C4-type Zn-finger protein